jgi:hypothetical protein
VSIADDEFPPDLRWPATSVGHGATVDWEGGPPGSETGRGTAAGIDGSGNLAVELESGRRLALGAGEVHLRLG